MLRRGVGIGQNGWPARGFLAAGRGLACLLVVVSLFAVAAGVVFALPGRTGSQGVVRLLGQTPVPMSIPVPTDKPAPAGSIPIEKVSNGCGGGGASTEPGLQNWVGDSATYRVP